MLNKRGIGHEIDWIIGVGLFIISITLIFVLFKPGIRPVYNPQTLLDIVDNGFNKDVSWEMTIVPVFVYPANETYSRRAIVRLSNNQIDVSCPEGCRVVSYETLTNFIGDKDRDQIETYYIARDDGDDAPSGFGVDENPLEDCGERHAMECDPGLIRVRDAREIYKDSERDNQINYNLDEKTLIIPVKLEDPISFGDRDTSKPRKTKYLVVGSSKDINFYKGDLVPKEGAIESCYAAGDSNWPYSDSVASQCKVIYELGLTESVSGIDLISFLGLSETTIDGSSCSVGYDCLKEKWEFPKSKEFRLTIQNLPPDGAVPAFEPIEFPGGIGAPINANVFVRQFNTFILTDDGTRLPVTVRMEIW